MTVKELIEFLKTQPQELPVVYYCHSEQVLMEKSDIRIENLGKARMDGWVHDARPDEPTVKYLVFPGN